MLTLLAYAKLNLFLHVLARRPDGFHEIDSLIQTIDLADRITIEVTDGGVEVTNDFRIPPEEDLAAQAAHLLLMEKRDPRGVKIRVEKRIPIGAGLGGGSSDAAAVLWCVDRLTPPPLSQDCLLSLAARLGSDVPLFLAGGQVRAAGRGERITPIPGRREERFLLLIPPVRCATAAVYACLDRVGFHHGNSRPTPSLGENDLEEAALHLYPELSPYQEAIASFGANYSGMSGSGSAFFAAFPDSKAATAAQEQLATSFPEAKIYLCSATGSGHHIEGEC